MLPMLPPGKGEVIRGFAEGVSIIPPLAAASVLRHNTEPRTASSIRQTWEHVLGYGLEEAEIQLDISIPEIGQPVLDSLGRDIVDSRQWIISPMGLFLPPEFQGKEAREEILLPMLRAVGMKGTYLNISSLEEATEQVGWSTTEDTLDAANLDRSPKELDNFFSRWGRTMIGLNQYLILAYFLKVTTGHFPDEKTSTFLANRTSRGEIGLALFRKDMLSVAVINDPDQSLNRWGTRSMEVL